VWSATRCSTIWNCYLPDLPPNFHPVPAARQQGRGRHDHGRAARAGGFGKTVLAIALARDEGIQDAFYDGVLWFTPGERPNFVQNISDVIRQLTDSRFDLIEGSDAAHRLKEVLEHRHCLLVIDDVWQQGHLRPFLDVAAISLRRRPARVSRTDERST
jgi:NB-ARC domain